MFNPQLIKLRRKLAIKNQTSFSEASYLFEFGQEILLSILEDLPYGEFKKILVLGSRERFPVNIISHLMQAEIDYKDSLEYIEPSKKFDLVISFFDVNWLLKPEEFFLQASNHLNKNGLIIGCCVGGSTLLNLRKCFITLEEKTGLPHIQRISPMIKPEDLTALLQYIGYKNVITSTENLEVEYRTVYKLLKDLKQMGESNSLLSTPNYSINKKLYKQIKTLSAKHLENFEILSFIASKEKDFKIKIQQG